MKIRSAILFAGALSAAMWTGSGAIAADLTDVGYVDQADVANLPVFANAIGNLRRTNRSSTSSSTRR